MRLRKLGAGKSKLIVKLLKRRRHCKKTKEQLKVSAEPFKNYRYKSYHLSLALSAYLGTVDKVLVIQVDILSIFGPDRFVMKD